MLQHWPPVNSVASVYWWPVSGEAALPQIRPETGLSPGLGESSILGSSEPTVLHHQPPDLFFQPLLDLVSPLPAHLHFTTLNPPPCEALRSFCNVATQNYCQLLCAALLRFHSHQRLSQVIPTHWLLPPCFNSCQSFKWADADFHWNEKFLSVTLSTQEKTWTHPESSHPFASSVNPTSFLKLNKNI